MIFDIKSQSYLLGEEGDGQSKQQILTQKVTMKWFATLKKTFTLLSEANTSEEELRSTVWIEKEMYRRKTFCQRLEMMQRPKEYSLKSSLISSWLVASQ